MYARQAFELNSGRRRCREVNDDDRFIFDPACEDYDLFISPVDSQADKYTAKVCRTDHEVDND
jgi:hypothetical protein